MTSSRSVKRDTRRAIDCIIDYFGDSAGKPALGGTERLAALVFDVGARAPALVPVPVMAAVRPAPSSRLRRPVSSRCRGLRGLRPVDRVGFHRRCSEAQSA
jgi:hypothetical protein